MQRRNYDVVDEISDLIVKGGIPTATQIRGKFDPDLGEKAFWAFFAPFYGFERDSGLPYARHPYDVVKRPEARGVYAVSPFGKAAGLNHDSPEDIWKAVLKALDDVGDDEGLRDAKNVRPIVAALAMLDILASTVNQDVAYGLPYNENGSQKRYGGVIALTDFYGLIAEPVLKDRRFRSRRDVPRFERVRREGTEYATLTDFGREHFITSLHELYDRFSVSREEIVNAYKHIRWIYQRFIEHHLNDSSLAEKGLELDEAQKGGIREIVQPFVRIIDQKLAEGSFSPASLEEAVRREFANVLVVFSDGRYLRPADLSLVPSTKSPYATTIRKTLYGANLSRMVQETLEAAAAFKAGEFPYQDDITFTLKGKTMDITDNISNMGPNIDDMTSQHRKARLNITEFAPAVRELRIAGIPSNYAVELYKSLEYLLAILKERIGTWHSAYSDIASGGSRRTGETSMKELAEKLGIMSDRIVELEDTLSGVRPTENSILKRISSLAGMY